MRQSSVFQDIARKERVEGKIEDTISVLEIRFSKVDDAIKDSLTSIRDEDILSYLLRQAAIAERKDDIERKILALSA